MTRPYCVLPDSIAGLAGLALLEEVECLTQPLARVRNPNHGGTNLFGLVPV